MTTIHPHRRTRSLALSTLAIVIMGWLPPAAAAASPPFVSVTAGGRPLAMLPSAMLPSAMLPSAMLPSAMLPSAMLPSAMLPKATMPPWRWPLQPQPRVVRPFDKPPGPYAAGHRGMDLAGVAGRPVLSVDAGTVRHSAVLAGRGTVTIEHAGGIRSTYEPLTIDQAVRKGAWVGAGQPIGALDLAGGHCLPSGCLHLGALRQGTSGEWDYVQPLFLLLPTEVVLLPAP